jgi:glycosyltransferase involved in cell wall biosynthesis
MGDGTVSILIATRNRADDLRATLASLAETELPGGGGLVELIVVDNGSSDRTAEVLEASRVHLEVKFRFQWMTEARPGKSRALNLGLRRATGAVVLFTDDDVRIPKRWIEPMTESILNDEVDAVAGGIRLAPHLRRPWMRGGHLSWLACTDHKRGVREHPTVGANAAIARRVFDAIPMFDPEVGPGAIGHAEDLLLWLQMREAGFRLATRFDVEVEHHPDERRLSRGSFAGMARKNGDWEAYVDYHWTHTPRRSPTLSLLRAWARLWGMRMARFPEWLACPCVPEWELELLVQWHMRRRYFIERQRPRNYDLGRPVKVRGELT